MLQHNFKITAIAVAVLSTLAVPSAYADTQLPTVVVQASGIPYTDSDATYASEVHDRGKIEASGATNLVDYLSQYTTLIVMSNFGNRFTPAIDMRGYGIANGFENIAVSVDGRRLNEIDLVPPLLGAIPIDAIDRIEITKGSGSVAFGDGATAGSIQIYTRGYDGASIRGIVGDHGFVGVDLNAGFKKGMFELSASAHNEHSNGTSDPDITNYRDKSENRNERAQVAFTPNDIVKLTLEGSNTYIDTRYVGPLTQAQYEQDPAQNGGNVYSHQNYETGQWKVGAEVSLVDGWKALVSRNEEQKRSEFITFASISNYDYETDEVLIRRKGKNFDISAGWQDFTGERVAFGSATSKDNRGIFGQLVYRTGDNLSLSAGVRRDRVAYTYAPTFGARLSSDQNLNAWDIGANYRLDAATSVYANYNASFLAPDIDRFFTFLGTFNGFIVPQKARTLNFGLNRDDANNRLRVGLFHARVRDEIFLDPISFNNTNLDRTHRYGLELQDTWQFNDQLALSALYTYTRAKIDNTSQGAGSFDGKEIPGVPHHGLTLGAVYQWGGGYSVNLNSIWRSSSYSMNDFANNLTQRQESYRVTNLSLKYQQRDWDAFIGVANLFDQKNGLWVRDDAIYPIDFTRSYKVGLRKSF